MKTKKNFKFIAEQLESMEKEFASIRRSFAPREKEFGGGYYFFYQAIVNAHYSVSNAIKQLKEQNATRSKNDDIKGAPRSRRKN